MSETRTKATTTAQCSICGTPVHVTRCPKCAPAWDEYDRTIYGR